MAYPPSAARLASQSSRSVRARPSVSQRPSGRRIPPFVTMFTRRAPCSRSARARSRSLWPRSASSRAYARAVSKHVTPASSAAAITRAPRSSSRSSSVDSRMQPSAKRWAGPAGGRGGASDPIDCLLDYQA